MGADKQPLRQWAKALAAGESAALARAISLAESSLAQDRAAAAELLRLAPSRTAKVRVGITGAGGAGKSTLIEKLGLWLLAQGYKIAVLAIDPTSIESGGSILGDKTRMTRLANAAGAFIRPSPSGTWGPGVGAATGRAIALVEAAGYEIILIETTGTGQTETAILDLADFIMLLTLPGGGDSLQGIKRGLSEGADLLIVSQADGAKKEAAQQTASAYQDALNIIGRSEGDWRPQAIAFSALDKDSDPLSLWQAVEAKTAIVKQSGQWETLRAERRVRWMHRLLNLYFTEASRESDYIAAQERAVRAGEISPEQAAFVAAEALVKGGR